jgi:hypothetical protein
MDTITTLATPLAVIALVTIAKDLGLPSKLGALLALVLGVSIHAAATYLDPGLWTVISQGIILGLGGSGIWDVTKTKVPELAAVDSIDVLPAVVEGEELGR